MKVIHKEYYYTHLIYAIVEIDGVKRTVDGIVFKWLESKYILKE